MIASNCDVSVSFVWRILVKKCFRRVLLKFIIGGIIIIRLPVGYGVFSFLLEYIFDWMHFENGFWSNSGMIRLGQSVTCLNKSFSVFVQFEILREIYFIDLEYMKHFQEDHSCQMWVCLLSCVSCVDNVDICFFRMRDRSRMEAIGKSTIDVSCEEVNMVGIEKLK